MRYAIRDYGGHTFSVENCAFAGEDYGVYTENSVSLTVAQCGFDGLRFGVFSVDTQTTAISSSLFAGSTPQQSGDLESRGIYGRRTKLRVGDCEFNRCYEGVRGDELSGGEIEQCRFQNAIAYACNCDGSDLEMTSSQISGGHVGVALAHLDGSEARLDEVKIVGAEFGIVAFEGDYDFDEVVVTDCLVGLYQGASNRELTVTRADDIDFNSNQYAIYCTRPQPRATDVSNGSGSEEQGGGDEAGEEASYKDANTDDTEEDGGDDEADDDQEESGDDDGEDDERDEDENDSESGDRIESRLVVEHQDLTDNRRAVRAFGLEVNLTDCTFRNSRYGVALTDCYDSEVVRCVFEGNPDAPDACLFAAYAANTEIRIKGCTTRKSLYGFYLTQLNDFAPLLEDNVLEHHTLAGIRLLGGKWTYSGEDQNTVRETRYGVVASSMDWAIENVTVDASCEIPILEFYGECTATGLHVPGGQRGLYAYGSQSLTLSDFVVENCNGTGIDLRSCDNIVIERGVSRNNLHGLHINDPDGEIHDLRECEFSGNRAYGLVLVGTTLSPTVTSNLTITDNRYGLSVRDQPLTITPDLAITIADNLYGIVCFRNELDLSEIVLRDNAVGIYHYVGGLNIDACEIEASHYAVISFVNSQCSISNTTVTGDRYGIYARAIADLQEPLQLASVDVSGTAGYAIGLVGSRSGTSQATLTNCSMLDAGRGLLTARVNIDVQSSRFRNIQTYGHYQYSGTSKFRGCQFSDVIQGWAIYAVGDRCDVARSRFARCRYGIGLLASSGRVSNSTIQGSYAGIYMNRSGGTGDVYHVTVADGTGYGVLRYGGDLTLRNSIVQATNYGLYDNGSTGDFDHTHNIVNSTGTPYRNTAPGSDELTAEPNFVDAATGDLRLASGSPAINAGIDLRHLIATDIDGFQRPTFDGFELGAHEFMDPSGSLRVIKWDEVAR